MESRATLMTPKLERALRWAAECHQGQSRKGNGAPYFEHPAAVALILDRAGFAEDVVIAGLLHDVVEDTDATLEQVEAAFGAEVAATVAQCTETKLDSSGRKRPWIDRKTEHIEAAASATVAARAVMLADKLHNLISMEVDLRDGRPIWSLFNADRTRVLWYYVTMIDRLGAGDPRLGELAARCREILTSLAAHHVTP